MDAVRIDFTAALAEAAQGMRFSWQFPVNAEQSNEENCSLAMKTFVSILQSEKWLSVYTPRENDMQLTMLNLSNVAFVLFDAIGIYTVQSGSNE